MSLSPCPGLPGKQEREARHHDLPEIPKNKSQCPSIFSIQTHYIQDFVFTVEVRYKPDPGQDGGAEQSHCVVVYDIELNTQNNFFFGLEAHPLAQLIWRG
jgi:hypothetical protein